MWFMAKTLEGGGEWRGTSNARSGNSPPRPRSPFSGAGGNKMRPFVTVKRFDTVLKDKLFENIVFCLAPF